jgi:hypothetical protein
MTIATYSSQSKQELLTELQSSLEALQQFLESLPVEELTANHGVMHHNGEPATVTHIIDSLASDYQDHMREVEEWLNKP